MSGGAWADLEAGLLECRPLDLQQALPLLRSSLPEVAALDEACEGRREGRPGESALEHTWQVLVRLRPRLRGLPAGRARALCLAALLHEVGRSPLAGPVQRRASHEQAGAALARDALFRLRLAGMDRDEVVYLVRLHGLPSAFGAREAQEARMLRLAWTVDTRLLYLLASADLEASTIVKGGTAAASLAAFRARCEELGVFGRQPPQLIAPRRWRQLAPGDARLRRRTAGELRFWRLKGRIATPEQAEAWLATQPPRPGGTLYLPVGVPGSGKSTWVAKQLPEAHIISMDEMRERLTGSRADQSRNAEVYRICRGALARALRAGETVVWDAQSHTWAARQGLLALARESHAYVIVVYMDVPLTVALARNAGRAVTVPEAVIVRSYRALQEPRPFEAEELWRVDVDGHCTRHVSDEEAGA